MDQLVKQIDQFNIYVNSAAATGQAPGLQPAAFCCLDPEPNLMP